jgi:hypothetical protein
MSSLEAPLIIAPIFFKGVITRSIGRLESDGAASNIAGNFWQQSKPHRIRIVVPDSAEKSETGIFLSFGLKYIPVPLIVSDFFVNFAATPNFFIQFKVAKISLLSMNGFMVVLPLQSDERITALWDMDLSGGTIISFLIFDAGFILYIFLLNSKP